MTLPFEYSSQPHTRRHGPQGYAGHESYRPFLRDEFAFRCIYCLRREVMGQAFGEFAVDHFLPVKHRPDLITEYSNLLYVCIRCNLRKMERFVADPLMHLVSDAVIVHADGMIEARTRESRQIVRILKLNEPNLVSYRRLWIRILEISRNGDAVLYRQIFGFPADLPDLSRLQPPGGNTKPEGVEQSYFRQRERGELPETY
jgi:HNH endonuclease